MKRLILLLLFFTIAYAQAQDAAPDSSKLINPAFTFFKSHNGADTSIYGKSGNDWWIFARQSWVSKYFLRSADSAKYVTVHYFNTHGSSTAHADSLFALAEKSANKTATPSTSAALYPNWQGVSNYAYPLTGNPSGFISTITGITAGGDLTGTYPNPTVNTINGKTISYYDFTSSGQSQLNGKQATLVSGTNIKTINGTSILGSGDLTISGGGSSYTVNQPLRISGSTISLDTTTATTGIQTKGAALTQYNSLAGQINLATQALTDDPGIPALTGYTSNVAVAYGTIRLYPSATKAFRLRRSSDNVQQDFYFDVNGNVNRDDINKFIDGYRGYLTIWYDQSPNGINAIQNTTASQPYVVIENGVVKVRFESLYNGSAGESLTYTLGTGIDVSNTTVFEAYSSYIGAGIDAVYPAANITSRYLISSANDKLDLYIDGTNAAKPDALSLNGVSTSSLYSWSHNNYYAINSNSTTAKVTSNYSTVSLSPLASYTETQFKIGNKYSADDSPFSGDIFAYVQYAASQPDYVLDTLASRVKTPLSLVAPTDNNLNIAVVGDSESNGVHATNNQNYTRQMNSLTKVPLINFARGANNYAIQNASNYNTSLDACLVSGKTNVLFVWIGTNDLSGAAGPIRTPAQVYSDAVSYAQARHAAGWNKVVMLTAMDRGSVATFASFNTILKANTTDFDAVLDVAADSALIWRPGFGGNTTTLSQPDYSYFSTDNTHLNNNGYRKISSYTDNYIESIVSTNSTADSYGRRIKKLEDYISGLQLNTILNKQAIQHGSLGVDSGLYTAHIYGSFKPQGNLYLDANIWQKAANTGNIFINSNGASQTVIGGTYAILNNSVTYEYDNSTPVVANLGIAFWNPHNTTTRLAFYNDGSTTAVTNAYIEAGAGTSRTFNIYAYGQTTLGSFAGPLNLFVNGNGIGIIPYYVGSISANVPLVGLYSQATSPQAFLDLPPGMNYAKTAPLKFHAGATSQPTVEQGAVNFDGKNLYIGSGSTPVNQQIAYVPAHTSFTPATGSTITLLDNQLNIINPSGSLSTLTLTLPSSPANNDVIYIKYTQAISSITYSGGTIVGVPASSTAGSLNILTYDSATGYWY